MTIISLNIKEKIIYNISEIINFEDQSWSNLNLDIKLKVIHHLCNQINKNNLENINNFISIPLKNIRPSKLIQICGISKSNNLDIYEEYRKSILNFTIYFRNNYNSKNKNYNYGNLSKKNYNEILNEYNYLIYNYLNKNINIINDSILFNNLVIGNQQKLLNPINNNIKINLLYYKDKYLYIEFNNNIKIEMELFLTSEKITRNIPVKYKINLINIF